MLGTFLSFFTFINWAYDFQFFIPQTLTFFFFLNLVASHKLTFIKVTIASLFLFLNHFIIGTLLSIILLIKYVLVDRIFIKEENIKELHFLVDISIFITCISIFLNIQGFSIERYFQQADLSVIGGVTNPNFTGNVNILIAIFGFNFLLVILGGIHYFTNKSISRSRYSLFAIIYITINLTLFFLGPTYSGKFLIGIGIFSAILIVNYIKDININNRGIILFGAMILLVNIINYSMTFGQYLNFYSHKDGQISALDSKDNNIVNYLKTSPKNCLIVSDPYTQIIIAGLTNNKTADAQYMLTESRRKLVDFYKDPNPNSYQDLHGIKELKGVKNICFLYTSRIEEAVKLNNVLWVDNIYSYIVNNNYPIGNSKKLIDFMATRGYQITFQNENFILFENN